MSNNYYAPAIIAEHTLARGSDINSATTNLEAAFDKIPTEAQLKQDRVTYQGTETGSANVYAVALPYTISSYTEGLRVRTKIANENTGSCTLNVDGVGAISIKLFDGSNPASGDIAAGKLAEFTHDGTYFILTSFPATVVSAVTTSATDAATSAEAAAASETAAATSATNAATSATAAAAAVTTALAAKITISTSAPSGGSAGDIWYRVTV